MSMPSKRVKGVSRVGRILDVMVLTVEERGSASATSRCRTAYVQLTAGAGRRRGLIRLRAHMYYVRPRESSELSLGTAYSTSY